MVPSKIVLYSLRNNVRTWESIDTEDGPQTTDHRPHTDDGRHTLNLSYYNKPRGALQGLGRYYHWYVQISIGIGNEIWGPLNQKRGRNAPQATDLP